MDDVLCSTGGGFAFVILTSENGLYPTMMAKSAGDTIGRVIAPPVLFLIFFSLVRLESRALTSARCRARCVRSE